MPQGKCGANVLTIVLAGGVGERLRPLTNRRCKPAIPFGGTLRVIDFTLMNCVSSNLTDIYLLTQYKAESLARHCEHRWNSRSLSREAHIETCPPNGLGSYQGTADAVFKNLKLLHSHRPDVVLVLSGDHVYHADYQTLVQRHLHQGADVSVLTGRVAANEASSFGVLETTDDGRITRFIEKPADPSPYAHGGHCSINLGVYCFRPSFLVEQLLSDVRAETSVHDFGKNVLPSSLEVGFVTSCSLEDVSPDTEPYWRDVGTIDSLFDAHMDVLRGTFKLTDPRWAGNAPFHDWLPTGSPRGRNLISNQAEIGDARLDDCVISPGVVVDGADLEECVIFPRARIEKGTRLRRAIVEEGARVPAGTIMGFGQDSNEVQKTSRGVAVLPRGESSTHRMAPSKRRRNLITRRSTGWVKPRMTTCWRRGDSWNHTRPWAN